MAPQNVGPYPSSSSIKLFPNLATIFNPLLHLASSLQASSTSSWSSSHHPKPHMSDSEKPPAKRRKTVGFSAQVEMRHVDKHDGSVVDVETMDLHPTSDDEDPAYADLTTAVRNVDKNLFNLSKTAYDECAMPVTAYPAHKTWKYGRLDNLLRHYMEKKMARDVFRTAHKFKCRTSTVLLTLSRILKRLEEVKEAQDQEDEQYIDDESAGESSDDDESVGESSDDDENVGESSDDDEAQEDEEEHGGASNANAGWKDNNADIQRNENLPYGWNVTGGQETKDDKDEEKDSEYKDPSQNSEDQRSGERHRNDLQGWHPPERMVDEANNMDTTSQRSGRMHRNNLQRWCPLERMVDEANNMVTARGAHDSDNQRSGRMHRNDLQGWCPLERMVDEGTNMDAGKGGDKVARTSR